MNIMRKFGVRGSNPGGNNAGAGRTGGSNSQMNQSVSLGLMHLRKLIGDYTHAPSDDKIINRLPLFSKVFTASSTTEMIERFPEISSFTQAVSTLMVVFGMELQIRQRRQQLFPLLLMKKNLKMECNMAMVLPDGTQPALSWRSKSN